jgi:hypothetical protein
MKLNSTLTYKVDNSLQAMMRKQVQHHGYVKTQVHQSEHNNFLDFCQQSYITYEIGYHRKVYAEFHLKHIQLRPPGLHVTYIVLVSPLDLFDDHHVLLI